jgi:serine-type D-Ala-D-Ala carboxypeptidase/endopeptidase (penicillin-binding protein 4)
MNRHKFLIGLLLMLISICGTAQIKTTEIRDKIAVWQNSTALSHAEIGISVSDNQTGEMLIQTDPQLSLAPASILKLVTTATALEVFGPEFKFSTYFSYSGTIRNDTLFGNLQIIGGGDPTLGSDYFPENKEFLDIWIKALKERNIKSVKGTLVLDASIYDSELIPNTWIWEDIGNYYGAGASGISVFDDLYEIHLKSSPEAGKITQIIRISPEIPNLNLKNEVLSSDINSDQAYVFGSPMEYNRTIRGTIPKNQSDFVVKASVPNPAEILSNEFRKRLLENRISISGIAKYEKTKPAQSNQLSVIQSPPLKDIIKVTNHESVNLFAEHLLKHLAYQRTGLGTTKDGCKFIEQFWKDKGLDMSGFFMNDGSGLSRFNGITASQITGVLTYMKTKSKFSDDFQQSLASVGNGTLTVFNPNSFPDDCLHAKSGSMTRVRCYAGYLTTISGRQLSFAVMLNNFSCSQSEATKKIEELLLELRKM